MKKCSLDYCDNKYAAKGLCNSHWAQQRRHGKTWPIITDETPEERFWRNIKKQDDGCWVWTGAGSGKFYDRESGQGGYGQLRIRGNSWMAHRWAYEFFNGVTLKTEDTIDHLCRNTRCCNPEHLERLTLSENIRRKNLYAALYSENERLRKFIVDLGYDPQTVLGGDYCADVSPVPVV